MFFLLQRVLGKQPDEPAVERADGSAAPGYPSSSPAAQLAEDLVLSRGGRAASATALPGAGEAGDVMSRIEAAIEEVRPAIRMDGGDIELAGYREGTVTVRFKGACRTCPMAEMTLQLGVERVLRQLVPEVTRIEAI